MATFFYPMLKQQVQGAFAPWQKEGANQVQYSLLF